MEIVQDLIYIEEYNLADGWGKEDGTGDGSGYADGGGGYPFTENSGAGYGSANAEGGYIKNYSYFSIDNERSNLY